MAERTEWKCPHCEHINNQISVKCEDCGKYPYQSFQDGGLYCAGCNSFIIGIEGKNIASSNGTFLCKDCKSIEEDDVVRPKKAIYLVLSGLYSDFRIDAVFSSKELADKFVEKFGGDVETWELDPAEIELKDGWNAFEIIMTMDGDTLRNEEKSWDKEAFLKGWNKNTEVQCICHDDEIPSDEPMLHTFVIAKDKMHAVKIANERRIRYKLGRLQWKIIW